MELVMFCSAFFQPHHLVHLVVSCAGMHLFHQILANSFKLLTHQRIALRARLNKALAFSKFLLMAAICNYNGCAKHYRHNKYYLQTHITLLFAIVHEVFHE